MRARWGGLGDATPEWAPGGVDPDQIVVPPSAPADWPACLREIAGLIRDGQLDARRAVWRLIVFPGVAGAPGGAGPSTVVVLQVNHAFADGRRAAVLAGILLGRTGEPLDDIAAAGPDRLLPRAIEAAHWRRRRSHDTAAGRLPPAPGLVPALGANASPAGEVSLRTLVRRRSQLPTCSVTTGALVAVSEALSGYLAARGEDAALLTALVPMAVPGFAGARNRSVPEYVRLHPGVASRAERAALIDQGMADCRRRRRHPAFAAEQRALAALPGPAQRWVAARARPGAGDILAHTSLSSVHRGRADLSFGGCGVFMTAGYPYLTPSIGLAHGVHGIGDTVALSVHAAASAIADVDEYLDRLDFSLRA